MKGWLAAWRLHHGCVGGGGMRRWGRRACARALWLWVQQGWGQERMNATGAAGGSRLCECRRLHQPGSKAGAKQGPGAMVGARANAAVGFGMTKGAALSPHGPRCGGAGVGARPPGLVAWACCGGASDAPRPRITKRRAQAREGGSAGPRGGRRPVTPGRRPGEDAGPEQCAAGGGRRPPAARPKMVSNRNGQSFGLTPVTLRRDCSGTWVAEGGTKTRASSF